MRSNKKCKSDDEARLLLRSAMYWVADTNTCCDWIKIDQPCKTLSEWNKLREDEDKPPRRIQNLGMAL